MVDIVLKTNLAPSSFTNNNTDTATAVKVNTAAGSDVANAIAAGTTASLAGLSGATVAGNVLTTDGAGVLSWQPDDVGGAASSVPATGVTAGALPAGVTTTPASVVGFDAAALAAVPTAADTVQGKVALNLGTAAGDATNATDALTATGLTAILNGTAPNTSPNALQAAVASNPSQYGTFASVLAPTAAPTAANPATRLTNTNGEVFDWTGSAWVLVGNGFFQTSNTTVASSVPGAFVVTAAFTMPRDGFVELNAIFGLVFSGAAPYRATLVLNEVFAQQQSTDNVNNGTDGHAALKLTVTAGQVVTVKIYNSNGAFTCFTKANIQYI